MFADCVKHFLCICLLMVVSGYSISIENEHIRLNVQRDSGVFNLGTVTNQPLIDGFPDSFTGNNFRILYDGHTLLTNETGHPETAPLRDTTMMIEHGIVTTEWVYDDLIIWQKLRFIEEDSLSTFLNVEVFVYNSGIEPHYVGMQYFIDLNIGGNDNPDIAVPWDIITHETIFDRSEMPGYWLAYYDVHNHTDTSLFGMGFVHGREELIPDAMIIANADVLREISFDYSTSPAPIHDSAILLHWDERVIEPTETMLIAFNWGLPFAGFSNVEDRIEDLHCPISVTSHPNPFRTRTTIKVESNIYPTNTQVSIYDINGRKIERIFSGIPAATQVFSFAPEGLQSGVYLVVIKTENQALSYPIFYLR